MTPIDARKDSMGYQPPAMRARCDDCPAMRARCDVCAHVNKTGHAPHTRFICMRGGFYTTASGVCREYAPRDARSDARAADDIEQQLKALLARRRRLNCSGGRDGEDVALIRAALVAKQGGAA